MAKAKKPEGTFWKMTLRGLALVVSSIAALPAAADPAGAVTDVTDQARVKGIESDLQQELIRIGSLGHIANCTRVVDYVEQGNPDTSYAAICNVVVNERPFMLAMCNDRLIGKFSLSIAVSSNELGLFIEHNCPPGG